MLSGLHFKTPKDFASFCSSKTFEICGVTKLFSMLNRV